MVWGCEGVLLRVWVLCSFLFWYYGLKMVLSVASGETRLNGTRASWARVPISFLNSKRRWSGATWMKKRGYSCLVSSSNTKSGPYLNISETVLRTQLFPKLVLMGHFALGFVFIETVSWPHCDLWHIEIILGNNHGNPSRLEIEDFEQ